MPDFQGYSKKSRNFSCNNFLKQVLASKSGFETSFETGGKGSIVMKQAHFQDPYRYLFFPDKIGPLEKGMANHSRILASRTP